MPKYKSKPVVIEAEQFTGTAENFRRLYAWGCPSGDPAVATIMYSEGTDEAPTQLFIETPDGDRRAELGDWIVRGVKGGFYPCKPDIFAATYEAAE